MSEASQHETSDAQCGTGCVVMLSSDLMFVSRVKAVATQAGFEFRGRLPDDNADSIRFVLLDLSTQGKLASEIVAQCAERCPQARLIAYGPHVQVDKLDAARQAGIATVMTNGQFSSQLSQIFS
jgi:hypothetical protein